MSVWSFLSLKGICIEVGGVSGTAEFVFMKIILIKLNKLNIVLSRVYYIPVIPKVAAKCHFVAFVTEGTNLT